MKSILAPLLASPALPLLSQPAEAAGLDDVERLMPTTPPSALLFSLLVGLVLVALMLRQSRHLLRRQQRLHRHLRLTSSVFQHSNEGIAVTGADGRILAVNPAFERITGYTEQEVTGQNPRLLSSGRHDPAFYQQMWREMLEHGQWQGEFWNRRKDGELYAALSNIRAIRDESGRLSHFINMFTDITQLKDHQQRIDQLAHYDALTGLPNRTLLADRLQQATALAQRTGSGLAVCLLDLDVFKPINDRLGHSIGDELLMSVAQRLQGCLRAGDTLARVGGDEFVLLLGEIEHADACELRVNRVLRTLGKPFHYGEDRLQLSASAGVTLFPQDSADCDQLLRHASQAMYRAKETGRNRFHWFDSAHGLRIEEQQALRQRIGEGLGNDELRLYLQPKIDLDNGEVVGCEALLRWQHPQKGLLAPAAFLSAVEGSELELPVGAWVLETALGYLSDWAGQGLQLEMSINVSAEQLLTERFTDYLEGALRRHPDVVPAQLELEILETTALSSMERSAQILSHCRALGVRFALDDFGTGYSSLAYFRSLPVDSLKIDQSFVRDMLVDSDSLGIVESVVRLAQAFQRKVIAEGVESREHGERLQKMGCRYGQGYGIARPMPAEQFVDWLHDWRRDNRWRVPQGPHNAARNRLSQPGDAG